MPRPYPSANPDADARPCLSGDVTRLATCFVVVAFLCGAVRPLTTWATPGDTTADRVLGQVTFTFAGVNLVDDDGFDAPAGVAIDESVLPNRVYVADSANNRVLGWADTTAFASGDPADLVIGQANAFSYDCNAGGVSATSLCVPFGVAVDGSGNLYVADRENHRVLEYDTPFASGTTADRVFGQGGSFTTATCNGGGVGASSLCEPTGVLVDGAGNLYVADKDNSRVLEYDTPLASGTVADLVIGQPTFASSGCNSAGISANSLCEPMGVALDGSGNLYVADRFNRRVLEYDTPLTSDATADRVLGQGGSFTANVCNNGGVSANSLCEPMGLALDGSGNLFVADYANSRTLEYDTPLVSGTTADRVFGQGGSFTTNVCEDTFVSATVMCRPIGVALDAAGNLYVADGDNDRLLEFDTPIVSGTTADRVLGQVAFIHSGKNLVDERGLDHPMGIAVDRSVSPNRIYVSDPQNNRVLAWADAAAFTNGAPADLVLGQPDFFSNTCASGANGLCTPSDVAVDAGGNVYVADTLFNRVLEYDTPFTTDATADRVFGQLTFAGTDCNAIGVAPDARLCFPEGVAVDGAGNLYVSDSNNCRVLQYDAPLTNDTTADRVIGQGGSFTSTTCATGFNDVHHPHGLGVDGAGNLYIADTQNNRVMEYDAPTTTDTLADRQFGSQFCVIPPSANDMCEPRDVAVDSAGTLFVADRNHNRVLQYDTPLTSDAVADGVFGQNGNLTTRDCNNGGAFVPSATGLCSPFGVAIDDADNLYVVDWNNSRVLAFDEPGFVAPTATPTPTAMATPTLSPTPTTTFTLPMPPTPTTTMATSTATATATATLIVPTPTATLTPPPLPTFPPSVTPTPTTIATPPGCGAMPMLGCQTPTVSQKALLMLKDKSPDAGDSLSWKWQKGNVTDVDAYGEPVTNDYFQLCIYDGGGLLTSMAVPPGDQCAGKPCWHEKTTSLAYKDKDATPQGITAMTLKAGSVAGKAQIMVKGKGANLPMPTLGGALATPLTVQLINTSGGCWGAVYSAPFLKNDGVTFKDKAD